MYLLEGSGVTKLKASCEGVDMKGLQQATEGSREGSRDGGCDIDDRHSCCAKHTKTHSPHSHVPVHTMKADQWPLL